MAVLPYPIFFGINGLSTSASSGSDGIPIGTIIMRTSGFLKTSEGSKYLLCDGSEVPSTYPKLRSLMTHTPDLRNRVPQGAGAYAVNTAIEAGLPNIRGEYQDDIGYASAISGAFYHSGWSLRASQDRGYYGYTEMYFDASRCSSIYKDDCTTVQPPALAINFYIKAR